MCIQTSTCFLRNLEDLWMKRKRRWRMWSDRITRSVISTYCHWLLVIIEYWLLTSILLCAYCRSKKFFRRADFAKVIKVTKSQKGLGCLSVGCLSVCSLSVCRMSVWSMYVCKIYVCFKYVCEYFVFFFSVCFISVCLMSVCRLSVCRLSVYRMSVFWTSVCWTSVCWTSVCLYVCAIFLAGLCKYFVYRSFQLPCYTKVPNIPPRNIVLTLLVCYPIMLYMAASCPTFVYLSAEKGIIGLGGWKKARINGYFLSFPVVVEELKVRKRWLQSRLQICNGGYSLFTHQASSVGREIGMWCVDEWVKIWITNDNTSNSKFLTQYGHCFTILWAFFTLLSAFALVSYAGVTPVLSFSPHLLWFRHIMTPQIINFPCLIPSKQQWLRIILPTYSTSTASN